MGRELSRREGSGFVPGLLLGALLGVTVLSLVPIALAFIPLALLVSAKGLREVPRDRRRSAAGAGILIGAGAVFTYGALNTFVACGTTEDFCGNANIVPLFAFALFTVTCGVVVSVLTFVRSNP